MLEGVQGLEEEDTDIVISPWMMMISGGAGLGVLLLLALSALLIHKLVHAKRGYSAPTTQVNIAFWLCKLNIPNINVMMLKH